MSDEAASAAAPAGAMNAQDLLLPIVPSVITSLILEAVSSLSGTAKIGVAAALSLGLWGMTRRRPAARASAGPDAGAATGGPASGVAGGFVRQHWKGVLAAITLVAVGAVLITRFVFGRPTIATNPLRCAETCPWTAGWCGTTAPPGSTPEVELTTRPPLPRRSHPKRWRLPAIRARPPARPARS